MKVTVFGDFFKELGCANKIDLKGRPRPFGSVVLLLPNCQSPIIILNGRFIRLGNIDLFCLIVRTCGELKWSVIHVSDDRTV